MLRIKNKEVSTEPRAGLACCRLAGWLQCISRQTEHSQGHGSYVSFGVLMGHPRQEGLHRGPRNLFQQHPLSFWPPFDHSRGLPKIKNQPSSCDLQSPFLIRSQGGIQNRRCQAPPLRAGYGLQFSSVILVWREMVSGCPRNLKLWRECSVLGRQSNNGRGLESTPEPRFPCPKPTRMKSRSDPTEGDIL